jgi:hypothetical protein
VTLVDFEICRLLSWGPSFASHESGLGSYVRNLADLLYFIMFSKIVYVLKIMVPCILIIYVIEKLCCEWKTLFIPIVTDAHRRKIAALLIEERQKV